MNEEIKTIYFAGKFCLSGDSDLPLAQRLKEDYRSVLLGDPALLVREDPNLTVWESYRYGGPFYCEQASQGVFTSTDCVVVLTAERSFVENCDVYVAVFGDSFSVGTVVELGWAIELNKNIVILYKQQESSYSIASEYWFAIADALRRSDKVQVASYVEENEIPRLLRSVLGDISSTRTVNQAMVMNPNQSD